MHLRREVWLRGVLAIAAILLAANLSAADLPPRDSPRVSVVAECSK